MKIHHISLATTNLEQMVGFYKKYFGAVEYSAYQNPRTGLRTCFLEFDKGARLEVMTRPGFTRKPADHGSGYAHLAMDAGGQMEVDFLTQRLADDGYTVMSQPRVDGDGYYESTVLDPDGNWVEITAGRVAELGTSKG